MINSLFVTSATGEVLIERHWRGVCYGTFVIRDELNPRQALRNALATVAHLQALFNVCLQKTYMSLLF